MTTLLAFALASALLLAALQFEWRRLELRHADACMADDVAQRLRALAGEAGWTLDDWQHAVLEAIYRPPAMRPHRRDRIRAELLELIDRLNENRSHG